MSTDLRRSALLGVRDMLPLMAPAIPFGLVIGVAVSGSDLVPDLAGWLSSSLIFGGAAQLTTIGLLADGAAVGAAILAGLTVNARHVMYSAGLVDRFRSQPRWFRWFGPYLMIDQAFALGVTHEDTPAGWRAYYLGAGLFAWVSWQIVTGAGVVLGAGADLGIDIAFVVPALFLGLLVPNLTRRPAVVAAVVGAVVTAALWQIPNRGGMIVGGVAGVVAGYLTDRGPR